MKGLLAGVPLLLLAVAPPAQAAPVSATVGWWYELQQLPSVLPVTVPRPVYVPAGDLLVEGTTAGSDAVAAINVLLPDGRLPKVLTVPVVSTRGTAAVEVCKTLSGWAAAAVGAWDLRPVCDGKAIPMVLSADGKTLSADVSSLTKEGVLDVLLEPGTNARTGTALATSVTLGATPSLTFTAAPVTTSPAAPPTTAPTEAPTSAPPVVVVQPGGPPVIGTVEPPGVLPSVSAPPLPTEAPPVVAEPAAPKAVKKVALSTTRGRSWALWLLLLTALAGLLAGRRRHDPTTVRGIGRYRTERAGTPPVRL